ncbi:Bug family tripartite tricarboxylate transporter substrate binding protein [Roseomonas populi]|uniref:Tripartite tricarboxylate transporter substrate binding protein n=1 Tax=Roseomonas populi TaxID=3121582 RepID=A0ABT1X1K8_9PROT|nr:tripartite tricarboxylate transporter substrate binding protein [Roseomonas pecuniae]MCR0981983.1 tripartite tricarboxylate transporter substrate binding protein [Roseomonas pecuniae]
MITRRAAIGAGLAAAALPLGRAWAAYPERPIRWIVGYAAGGGTDILARLVAGSMSARLGQPIVIENRPGAATAVGAEAAAKAAPDGYTLFTAGNETLIFNPNLYKRLAYDPTKDFAPIGLMARFHLVLTVKKDSGFRDAKGLIARAKAQPGAIAYGSPGVGSPHHLAMERLAKEAGVSMNHVPYRGMAPVLNDLMANTLEAAVVDAAAGGETLRSGRVRPLAVCAPERLSTLPDVPTVTEALGLPRFEAYAWQGVVAPARTPEAVIARLSQDVATALQDPAVRSRMMEIGLEPLSGGPADYAKLIADERAVWDPVVKGLNLSLD